MEVSHSTNAKEKVEKPDLDAVKSDDNYISGSDVYLPNFYCGVCERKFSSVETFEIHLRGEKHYKMVSQEKLMTKFSKVKVRKHKPSKAYGDSGDESDDFKGLYCEVCDKSISGYISYLAHMKGGIHTKNIKKMKIKDEMKDMLNVLDKEDAEHKSDEDDIIQKPFARCSTCQKEFSGPENFQQHLKSGTHKKKLQQMVLVENLKSKQPDELKDGDNEEEMTYSCKLCDKLFSGPVPYHIHLESAVHKRELKKAEVAKEIKDLCVDDTSDSNYTCKECEKIFSDPFAFKRHLVRNDHEKQATRSQILAFLTSHPEIAMIKQDESLSSDEGEKSNDHDDSYFLICELCHVSFSGPESAQNHVNSKKHLAVKKERRRLKHLKKDQAEKDTPARPSVQSGLPDNKNVNVKTLGGNSENDGKKLTASAETSLVQVKDEDPQDDFELV